MPPLSPRRTLALAVVLAVALVQVRAPAASATVRADPPLSPPVAAPVVDPFRPPLARWDAGNRGLEYATAPGTVVRATGDGEVVFAGSVARMLHVTVLHGNGLRSTTSFLASIDVVVGEHVRRGDALGRTGARLHVSVRAGDDYLDPAALFAGDRPPARLLPDDLMSGPPAAEARAEAALIAELEATLRGPGVLEVLGVVLPDVDALRDAWRATAPDQILARLVLRMGAWQRRQARCTRADVVPARPPTRRIAVLVGGLGSTSRNAGIERLDTAGLGYAQGDVLRFAYGGGRVPSAVAGDLEPIAARPYDAAATHADLRSSGQQLLELLQTVALRAPGVPIDVYAHSQGGILARIALGSMQLPATVDVVATIATPHTGADLATALAGVLEQPGADAVLDDVGPVFGLDPTAPSPSQLAEGSDVLTSLAPPPDSVRFVSIGARGDLVVPASSTEVAGAPSLVVPTAGIDAHQRVVGDAATRRALALTLAGLPLPCETFTDTVLDSVVGDLVEGVESVAGGVLELPHVPDRPLGDGGPP